MKSTSEIAKLLGSRGGLATRSKYGNAHFKKLASLSAEKRRKKKLEVVDKQENT